MYLALTSIFGCAVVRVVAIDDQTYGVRSGVLVTIFLLEVLTRYYFLGMMESTASVFFPGMCGEGFWLERSCFPLEIRGL